MCSRPRGGEIVECEGVYGVCCVEWCGVGDVGNGVWGVDREEWDGGCGEWGVCGE